MMSALQATLPSSTDARSLGFLGQPNSFGSFVAFSPAAPRQRIVEPSNTTCSRKAVLSEMNCPASAPEVLEEIGSIARYTTTSLMSDLMSSSTDVKYEKSAQPEIPGKYRFGDTRNIISDVGKLTKLGWSPQYSPETSVSDYLSWLRSQKDIEDVLDYAEKTMKNMNVVRKVNV